MKQFIQSVLATLLFICIIFIANGLVLNQFPLKNAYTEKRCFMEQNASAIKTLVAGHSQLEWGLNIHELGDSAYCLAMSGRVIHYDERLLARYLPTMPNLRTLILPMHYTFLGFNNFYTKFDNRKNYVYHYWRDWDIPYCRYFYHYIPYHYSDLANDGIDRPADSLGYGQLIGVFEGADTWYGYEQMGQEEFCTSLTQIARLCLEHNVRLVVITTPCANAFCNMITTQGMANLYQVIDTVKAQYPIEYFNYIADSQFRADSIYADGTHLNHTGATLFGKRLKNDLGL